MSIKSTNCGNGKVVSPAKYEAAVAADTTAVTDASRRVNAAPNMANCLEDMLSLYRGKCIYDYPCLVR